jgi:hypothetical protein
MCILSDRFSSVPVYGVLLNHDSKAPCFSVFKVLAGLTQTLLLTFSCLNTGKK